MRRAGRSFAGSRHKCRSRRDGSTFVSILERRMHVVLEEGSKMPEQETLRRAQRDKQQGKAPSTQAGEFVREEMHHIREGKHGAASTKQAIAIGLSKARRSGVDLPPPPSSAKRSTKRSAASATRAGRSGRKPSATRSRATSRALKRQGRSAASRKALSRQARTAARRRSATSRSQAARRAARTKAQTRRRRATA